LPGEAFAGLEDNIGDGHQTPSVSEGFCIPAEELERRSG